MIKVKDETCTIKGFKDDVITELEVATHYILENLSILDKIILLHTITDIINKSINGEKTDE